MRDSFEFTWHSPLTQEDWKKLSDAELENAMSVTFQTPQGRQVRYIKCEVLDKIRAEIINLANAYDYQQSFNHGLMRAVQIIDKYREEQEDNGFFDEIMDDESEDEETYEKIKEIIDKVKEQEE
jgi:hypothetical protein